jgi:hypothetical protein
MNKSITIENVIITQNSAELYFKEDLFKYAWLENIDKHFPDIYELDVSFEKKNISISSDIFRLIRSKGIIVKLSLSNEFDKINYVCDTESINNKMDGLKLQINEFNEISFYFSKINSKNSTSLPHSYPSFESYFKNYISNDNPQKHSLDKCPLKIVVLGTCFARSVFKSDSYFNPDYKQYFKVEHTFFHNSLISLMSDKIEDESYLKISDFNQNEVFRYIDVEFKKNFFDIIDYINPDFIVIDNYIDANRPLIQISKNQFITYNSYFSKSIYKRNFSGCKIFYPYEENYSELFRNAASKFSRELKIRNLDDKVILLGGRLSEYKLDKKTGKVEKWEKLASWIQPSNKNWDIMDSVFLEEMPKVNYIDMRKTKWKSDIDCTIIKGGASPSHYQSEYYKEIFEKLKSITLKEDFISNE